MREKITTAYNRYERFLEIAFVIMLSMISISLIFNNNAWVDEIYSMRWTALSWKDMMGALIGDVHPPLYYFMLKIVNGISGDSLVIAKLFSVVPVVIYLLLGITFVKKQFGRKAMYFWWLFVFFAPCMLDKTVEVRMYTWTTLFCILAGISMYYLFQHATRRNWICFTLSALAAAYTHYYGLATMIFVYMAISIYFVFTKNWKNVRSFFICCLMTVIGYLPWLGTAIKQITTVNGDYWIQPPSSRLSYIRELVESSFPYSTKIFMFLILSLSIYLFVLFLVKKKMELYWALAVCVPLWCVMFGAQIYGTMVRPVLISRYLVMAFCMMIMGLSVAWKYLNKYLLILPCCFFTLVGIVEYGEVYEDEYGRLTDRTVEFTRENIQNDELIAYDIDSMNNAILYYVPNAVPMGTDYDIYMEDYETLWYFSAYEDSVDWERLESNSISYENFGTFGFDNIYFTMYKLTK